MSERIDPSDEPSIREGLRGAMRAGVCGVALVEIGQGVMAMISRVHEVLNIDHFAIDAATLCVGAVVGIAATEARARRQDKEA